MAKEQTENSYNLTLGALYPLITAYIHFSRLSGTLLYIILRIAQEASKSDYIVWKRAKLLNNDMPNLNMELYKGPFNKLK